MVDLSSIIGDPSVATQNIPFARGSGNPFLLPFEFAQNAAREREGRSFLQTLAGNNQLRAILAQRLAAQDAAGQRFSDIAGNLDKFQAAGGATGALNIAGFQGNEFSRAADPAAIAGLQGTAQTALSEATLKAAEAGQPVRQSNEQFQGTDFTRLPDATPLGVQKSTAAARVPQVTVPGGAGSVLKFPANLDEVAKARDRINRVPRSSAVRQSPAVDANGAATTVPATEAQQIKAQEIIDTLSRVNVGRKTYEFRVRPDDKVAEIVETDVATGLSRVVNRFDEDGGAVSE